jgi:UDP-N-acetylmuramoyl-tripeptide--D-alanyl-D-alanine ligase
MKLSEIAYVVGGELIGLDCDVAGFSTDTRSLQAGDLFIALSGPNFDANEFVVVAAEKGAIAAIVTRVNPQLGIAQVVVDDSHRALGQIAAAWRARFVQLRRVAITGSAGKTSVKEMVASIFATTASTLATKGNFNNDIGVPLTLLRLREEHQFGVFELGANHIGEIAYTSSLVAPHAAVIVNVGTAHLEGFGSREGIAKAKSEIYQGLVDDGVAIINGDDDFASYCREQAAPYRVLTFSQQNKADVYASDIQSKGLPTWSFTLHIGEQQTPVNLQMLGRHQVGNALAAASLAHACGMSINQIKQGLESCKPVAGRTVLHRLQPEQYLVDDTYNASPNAMRAAIDLLADMPGRKVLVLGDMAELGATAAEIHQDIGAYAQMKKINALYATGKHAADYQVGYGPQAQLFPDHQALLQSLEQELQGVVSVLVKGSRSARMEHVVQGLTKSVGETAC